MVSIFSTRAIKLGQSLSLNDKIIQKFELALKRLCLNLAQQIIVDGEGAKKFLTVKVINATERQKNRLSIKRDDIQ